MKKSTIVLLITGVLCTIISISCFIAAAVILTGKGVNLAQTTIEDPNFDWDTEDGWLVIHDYKDSEYYDGSEYYDDTEKVDVNLPFLQVHVDGDDVKVSMPGLNVDVDENSDKVNVYFGETTVATE